MAGHGPPRAVRLLPGRRRLPRDRYRGAGHGEAGPQAGRLPEGERRGVQGMTRTVLLLAALLFPRAVPAAGGGPPARPGDGAQATFYQDVVPVLKAHCLGCHSGDRPKGRLDMSTLEGLKTGGKHGTPFVPGKPEESLLYLLVTGAKKPSMPPEKEMPLREEEIARLRAWILSGCAPGEMPHEAAP